MQQKIQKGVIGMYLEQLVERLWQVRQAIKGLMEEEERLKEEIGRVVEVAGGKLVVGRFRLSLNETTRPKHATILKILQENHPELTHEISELLGMHRTTYKRLDIIPF